MLDTHMQLVPASQFSLDELTAAYNETRVDYLVPMPMNSARLSAYIKHYHVHLDQSVVAVDDTGVLGLGMLGVRPGATWITRLGVLPGRRRRGTGEAIMVRLLENSERLDAPRTILEVIKGNGPAHQLFLKLGFVETRELFILRRPPGRPPVTGAWRVTWLDQEDALRRIRELDGSKPGVEELAWTNQIDSLAGTGDTMGLTVELENGSRGWLVFRREKFLLSHLIFHTEQGEPRDTASALISHLYQRYPLLDTYTENISIGDPHLSAMLGAGFFEVFRRIEMMRAPGACGC